MELLRYVLGSTCLTAGSLIIFASYMRQIANYRSRNKEDRQWSSPVPFIGPVLVILGYFLLPIEFSNWIFLVIVLDPDTVITFYEHSLPFSIIAGIGE